MVLTEEHKKLILSKKHFFFDLDDTLIGTYEANKLGLKKAYNKLASVCHEDLSKSLPFEMFENDLQGIYKEGKKEILIMNGKKMRKWYDLEPEIFEEYCRDLVPKKRITPDYTGDSLAALLYWEFKQTKYQVIMPRPHGFDVISKLKDANKTIHCISEGRCHLQHTKLMLTGLYKKFDFLKIVELDKPAELKLYVEQQKINPNEAVIIGDSPNDMDAGKNSGMMAIYYNSEGHKEEHPESKADATISCFSELLEVLTPDTKV